MENLISIFLCCKWKFIIYAKCGKGGHKGYFWTQINQTEIKVFNHKQLKEVIKARNISLQKYVSYEILA